MNIRKPISAFLAVCMLSCCSSPTAVDQNEIALELSAKTANGDEAWSFTVFLINNTDSMVKLVKPGDGSWHHWRTPLIGWSVISADDPEAEHPKEPPPNNSPRCGNVNPLQPDDVFELDQGQRIELKDWIGFPDCSGKGSFSVVFYYSNVPDLEWSGLDGHDPETMKKVKSSTPCSCMSNEVIIEL